MNANPESPADGQDRAPFIFAADDAASAVAAAVNPRYLADETPLVRELADLARVGPEEATAVRDTALRLVESVRRNRKRVSGLDAFLQQYDLSSQEGVVLMCLAEALLRVPDKATADRLIADKLTSADWRSHLGTSESTFVNASTWGLMLTGRIIRPASHDVDQPGKFMQRLVSRLGEPVVRGAMRQAMRIMGHQFVMGRTIGDALKRASGGEGASYRYSFDMLGEAALTAADSQRYLEAYHAGIRAIAAADRKPASIFAADSISVKLSALFPRYEFAKRERVLEELTPRILDLAVAAREAGVGLTVDAEEADRLQISLELFERVYRDDALQGWDGFGLAVQSYLKRGLDACRWVIDLAEETGRCIPVRLVKGAYWDAEIKRAQENGLDSYPVFTRKVNSDVSFLACARVLLGAPGRVYPQFATHNAHSVASIIHFAGDNRQFEFQRLHGMGEELYAEVIGKQHFDLPCRVYAPVGNHEDLLPYLVRRLLENGSNTSFVNRIVDEEAPVEQIVADPVATVDALDHVPHPRIPAPAGIFGAERANSRGVNLADPAALHQLAAGMRAAMLQPRRAMPVIDGRHCAGDARAVRDPADNRRVVGEVVWATEAQARQALEIAHRSQPRWNAAGAAARATVLERAADLFESNAPELLALCVREAGKTLPDAVSELREAVDFLRYYAAQAKREFRDADAAARSDRGEQRAVAAWPRRVRVHQPVEFPAGDLHRPGRRSAGDGQHGAGQAGRADAARRVRGSAPAARSRRPRRRAAPAAGRRRGASAPRCSLMRASPASPSPARRKRRGSSTARWPPATAAIATLIAETGGQNAMLVDSSALPEQVVLDTVRVGLQQRRAALLGAARAVPAGGDRRRTLRPAEGLHAGAAHRRPGAAVDRRRPGDRSRGAGARWKRTSRRWRGRAGCIAPLPPCRLRRSTAPSSRRPWSSWTTIGQLEREVFGPVLHVVRYAARGPRAGGRRRSTPPAMA